MLEDDKRSFFFCWLVFVPNTEKEKSEESKKMVCEATQCEQD